MDLAEVIRGTEVGRVAALPNARPLHRGELEAIALAWERGLPVLLEDGDARQVAKAIGLKFVGVDGLVLAGATRGAIDKGEALRILDALVAVNRLPCRLRDALAVELHIEDVLP